jgi:hypothetical protein
MLVPPFAAIRARPWQQPPATVLHASSSKDAPDNVHDDDDGDDGGRLQKRGGHFQRGISLSQMEGDTPSVDAGGCGCRGAAAARRRHFLCLLCLPKPPFSFIGLPRGGGSFGQMDSFSSPATPAAMKEAVVAEWVVSMRNPIVPAPFCYVYKPTLAYFSAGGASEERKSTDCQTNTDDETPMARGSLSIDLAGLW